MPERKQNEESEDAKDVPLPPSSGPGLRRPIDTVDILRNKEARDPQEVRMHRILDQAAATARPIKMSTKGDP